MSHNFSHSLLTKLVCPKKVQFHFEQKPEVKPQAMNDGILLHTYCEDFLRTGRIPEFLNQAFRDKFMKIHPYLDKIFDDVEEYESKFDREDGDFKTTCRVDAILRTESGIWILDWKFVGKPWTQEKFEGYRLSQGLLYLWICSEFVNNLAGIKFIVVSDEDLHPVEWTVPFVQEEVDRALNFYRAKNEQIRSIKEFGGGANPGMHCNWCSYKTFCPDRWVRR